MSQAIPSTGSVTLSDFDSVRAALPTGEPAWLAERRAKAADRFAALGVPTRRHEEWRYTNLRVLEELALDPAPSGTSVTDEQLKGLEISGLDAMRLVFVDGRLDESRSNLVDLPAGVKVSDLATAIEADDAIVREHLGSVADEDDLAFVALNEALMSAGVVIEVPAGVKVETPIHVLAIATGGGGPSLASVRNLIVCGDDAEVTLIEDHATTDAAALYVTNAVTEVVAGDRAHVHRVLIERESDKAIHVTRITSRQGSESNVDSHSILLGGSIVRNEVNPRIQGAGSDSLLNGLYAPRGDQHMDNHMRVEHRVGACTSRQYYRGLLTEKSTGVFSGRIVVFDEASETDAIQNCQNLLLSPDARAVTKPQLEIYDADVQCTHGATTGQLVPEQLFYLMARGVPEAEARGLLVYAFAGEGIDRVPVEPLQQWIHEQFRERLPYAADVEDVMD